MEIIIKPLKIIDYYDLLVEAHKETFYITFARNISDEFLKGEFLRMQKDALSDENSVVAAYIENNIAGLTVLETRTNPDETSYGWIHFIYVLPSYRRMGVASQLATYSAGYFSRIGLDEFCLRTGENNIVAQEFYLNSGFVHDPEYDRVGLNGINELMMRYDLSKNKNTKNS